MTRRTDEPLDAVTTPRQALKAAYDDVLAERAARDRLYDELDRLESEMNAGPKPWI